MSDEKEMDRETGLIRMLFINQTWLDKKSPVSHFLGGHAFV